jgi:hypothetical protein
MIYIFKKIKFKKKLYVLKITYFIWKYFYNYK